MLIPLDTLIREHGVQPGPVLHVGAHLGEEAADYYRLRFGPVHWVEANADLIDQLKLRVRPYAGKVVRAVPSFIADVPVTLHLASNGQSSSLLELGTHATEHPEVTYVGQKYLVTTTVDKLLTERVITQATFVNIDVQGTELDVLRGATTFLEGVSALYLEVNERELYKGCALLPEVDQWLSGRGFTRVATHMTNHGWGDALYVR